MSEDLSLPKYERDAPQNNEERQHFLDQIAFRFVDLTFAKIFEDPIKRRSELRCRTVKHLVEDALQNQLTAEELERWNALQTEWETEKKSWQYIHRALKVLQKGNLDIVLDPTFSKHEEKPIGVVIQECEVASNDSTGGDIRWIYQKIFTEPSTLEH